MRIACWIPKATDIFSEYVLLIALPLQQRLHKRASNVTINATACLLVSRVLPSSVLGASKAGVAQLMGFHIITLCKASPTGRAVLGVGLRPLTCWDYGFEYLRGHRSLSLVSVVLLERGPCVGPITRPEESNWVWCVWGWLRDLTQEAYAHYGCRATMERKSSIMRLLQLFAGTCCLHRKGDNLVQVDVAFGKRPWLTTVVAEFPYNLHIYSSQWL